MAVKLGEALIYIRGDTASLAKGFQSSKKQTESFASSVSKTLTGGIGGAIKGIGQIAGGILGADLIRGGINALVGFTKSFVTEAMNAQMVGAQLDQVLVSTKGAAGMTRAALDDLADGLSQVTPVEDDAIAAGEAMLLTFVNVGKNVFPAATEAMLDMATAMNSGAAPSADQLKTTAMQLGKALNDPIAGMGALKRVGVAFTKDQAAMIKGMVAAGKTEEAQALILKELQTEFGGSARAAGKTLPGALKILQNTIGNVKETIGGALIPVLTRGAKALTGLVVKNMPAIENFGEAIADGIGRAVEVAGAVWDAFNVPGDLGYRMTNGLLEIANQIGGSDAVNKVADAIGLGKAIIASIQQGDWAGAFALIKPQLVAGFNSIWGGITTAWEGAADRFEGVETIAGAPGLKDKLVTAFDTLKGPVTEFVNKIPGWIYDELLKISLRLEPLTQKFADWATSEATTSKLTEMAGKVTDFVIGAINGLFGVKGQDSLNELPGALEISVQKNGEALGRAGAAIADAILEGMRARAYAKAGWMLKLFIDYGGLGGMAREAGAEPSGKIYDPGGWHAGGLDAVFRRPTVIGVGEAGAERVTVTPRGKEAARGNTYITVHATNGPSIRRGLQLRGVTAR